MPPPQRLPSLPGATQATKKAFKPPARVSSDPDVDSVASRANNRPSTSSGAAKTNASKQLSVTSHRAGPGASASRAAPSHGKNTTTTGFVRAADLEDIEMISSDDDIVFDATEATNATRPASKAADTTTLDATNKRTRLSRLPSLSDSSTEPTGGLSPVQIADIDSPELADEPSNEISNMGTDADEIPLLPAPLITRLLHESFDDKQMKISANANALMGRYLDVFVREAVARAALAQRERKDNAAEATDDDMDADIWLDTKDLEEIAPGLVLDF